MIEGKLNIAGMSMGGGRKDNFYFCLMEYYPQENRWFLKSLLTVREDSEEDGDIAIGSWAVEYDLQDLVVDFPLTQSACQSCQIICPGHHHCPIPEVVKTKGILSKLLRQDQELYEKDPKNYERIRLDESDQILSRSFKRKLKKGYLPYWNRPIDLWIWMNYHDEMNEIFGTTYDSFGNSSLMLLSRFFYLRRHFPPELKFFEGHMEVCLLELLRAGVLTKKNLKLLSDLEQGAFARLEVVKAIEDSCQLFIYEHDLETIVKSPKAFRSFLLALCGQRRLLGQIHELPQWTNGDNICFLSPYFSN